MKKWILLCLSCIFLFSSCGLKDGKVRIQNECPWTITVTAKSGDFSQTETLKSNSGWNFDLELNTQYEIEISDSTSSDVWKLTKTTPFIATTWYVSWKNFTYVVK